MLFYVFVYTIWLKPRSPQNIVIGGAAGAVPVLVGWAAVTGSLAAPAWVLFAIVFFWTPPHFWALALRYRDDYAGRRHPDAPGREGRRGRHPSDPRLLRRRGRASALTLPLTIDDDAAVLRRSPSVLGVAVRRLGAELLRRDPTPTQAIRLLHVLEHLPRAALRGRCRRHPRRGLSAARADAGCSC